MAKIILKDGTEEFLSPGAAQAKVTAGEAVWAQGVPMYSTRQLVAEPIKVDPVKKRRKRKPKPVEEVVEVIPEEPTVEPEQVDTDEVE